MVEKDVESQENAGMEKSLERSLSGSKFRSLWRGEWKEETRIPFWHAEFAETRMAVAKEWGKTSESKSLLIWLSR